MKRRRKLERSEAHEALSDIQAQLAQPAVADNIADAAWFKSGDKLQLHVALKRHPTKRLELSLPDHLGGGVLLPHMSVLGNKEQWTWSPKELSFAPSVTLAPGSQICVMNASAVERAGVACFVLIDNTPCLVTAGHVFDKGAERTAIRIGGVTVARLSQNLLESKMPVDAAICALTPAGVRAAALAADSPSWSKTVATASEIPVGASVLFYPTHERADGPYELKILNASVHARVPDSCWRLEFDDMLQARPMTECGDSGSIALYKGRYCGLCTGRTDHSYFTPISKVIVSFHALQPGKKIALWQPSGSESSSRWQLESSFIKQVPRPVRAKNGKATTPRRKKSA